MKTSLKLLILLSSLSATIYAEDRIYNYNGERTGTINVTDETTSLKSTGAVDRNNAAGTTTLKGDITLTGKSEGANGSAVSNWNNGSSQYQPSVVILETASTSDSINLSASTAQGRGVHCVTPNRSPHQSAPVVTLNANYGDQLQKINITATGEDSDGLYALSSGIINVTGDTTIRATMRGIDSAGDYAYTEMPATTITVSGKLDVAADVGIRASDGGIVDLSGCSYVKAVGQSAGISASKGLLFTNGLQSEIILGSHVDVSASAGAALNANQGKISGTGNYMVNGFINADTSGLIDLVMLNGSSLNGYTNDNADAGNITLAFRNGARWNNTAYSTMTDLSVEAGASIFFNDNNSGALFSIDSNSVSLEVGSLLKIAVDGSTVEVGDKFTLFTGLDVLWDNGGADYNAELYSADGKWLFTYVNPEGGVFEIIGKTAVNIPEPATATLGLLGLAGLLVRRRR